MFLKTPAIGASPISPYVDIVSYWDTAFTKVIDEKLPLNYDSNPVTLVGQAFLKYKLLQPVMKEQQPAPGSPGPFGGTFVPDSPSTKKVRVVFEDDFSTPNGCKDPLLCTIDNIRRPCSYANCGGGDLKIDINVAGMSLNTGTTYQFSITTEFVAPTNGIVYPTNPGYYYILVETYNSGNSLISKYSDYIYVPGDPVSNIKVTSLSSTINQYNIFTWDITAKVAINAYNAATPGRIYLEFPTSDPVGTAFAADLGGYSATGDYVGCWFSGLTAISTLRCQLI